MQKVKNLVKKIIIKILARRELRLALLFAQAPVTWIFISFGKSELFDKQWYTQQCIGIRGARVYAVSPLFHYLIIGRLKGLSPNPFFVGQVYDPLRWQASIMDPLLKYCVRSKTWDRPTSLVFHPADMVRTTKLPPLLEYLRSGEDRVYFDTRFSISSKINKDEVIATLANASDNRRKEIEYKLKAEPTGYFNTAKESDLIVRYKKNDIIAEQKQPVVSIVMPVWNREGLVSEAIESVIAQSLNNWELLIVDDGSIDSTVKIIETYTKKDPRIQLLKQNHEGVCAARNLALKAAKGKFVAFLDSDNTWTSYYLQTAIGFIIDNGVSAGYAAIKMDTNGSIRYRTTKPDKELLRTGNYIDLNALVVERSIVKRIGYFDESLRRMVDYDLVCKISSVTDFVYIPILAVNYTDHDDLVRISTTEPVSWDGVVKNNNFVDWDNADKHRKKELISIILPVRGDINPVISSLERLLKYTPEKNVEIILADASSDSATNMLLSSLTLVDDRIIHYREPAARDAVLVTNYAFARSRGEYIVVLNVHTLVDEGWLMPLVAEVNKDTRTIAGPVQLKMSRVIRSAGVEYYGENVAPVNILENHPVQDLYNLPKTWEVDSLSNGCFAVHARLFSKLKGLNPMFEVGFEVQELTVRARRLINGVNIKIVKGSVVLNPDGGKGWYTPTQDRFIEENASSIVSRTNRIWSTAGFRVDNYKKIHPETGGLSQLEVIVSRTKKQRRWAIKIAAPSNEKRFSWGDLYFAEALAKSLRRLDQFVSIDFHDHHQRPTSYLDDVVLNLRGLDYVQPQKGAINVMWVISHPEDVDVKEIRKYDKVYAAGATWSDVMSKKSHKEISTLLQCTDPEVFNVGRKNKEFINTILFVGNSRKTTRPIVRDAISENIDISVYGGEWGEYIDKEYIKGVFIPNDKLSQAYRSSRVVLNDHWNDMREFGFISNRIFDALASGASVITDNIKGIDRFIDSKLLAIYTKSDELRGLIQNTDSITENDRKVSAKYIHDHHSFDARAKQILSDVEVLSRR